MGKVVNERVNGFFYALGRVDVHLFFVQNNEKNTFFPQTAYQMHKYE